MANAITNLFIGAPYLIAGIIAQKKGTTEKITNLAVAALVNYVALFMFPNWFSWLCPLVFLPIALIAPSVGSECTWPQNTRVPLRFTYPSISPQQISRTYSPPVNPADFFPYVQLSPPPPVATRDAVLRNSTHLPSGRHVSIEETNNFREPSQDPRKGHFRRDPSPISRARYESSSQLSGQHTTFGGVQNSRESSPAPGKGHFRRDPSPILHTDSFLHHSSGQNTAFGGVQPFRNPSPVSRNRSPSF